MKEKFYQNQFFLSSHKLLINQLTGKDLNLTSNQVGLFTKKVKSLKGSKEFVCQQSNLPDP